MVILEDPRHDRYIVQPVVRALLTDLGLLAHVDILTDPRIQGLEEAIDRAAAVVERYPQHDAFLLVADRDGDGNRASRFEALAVRVRTGLGPSRRFLYCLAEQEVEAWLLAAQWASVHQAHPDWRWPAVRAARDVKERYFQPFFAPRRDDRLPGQGRSQMMTSLKLPAVVRKCPELARLRADLAGL